MIGSQNTEQPVSPGTGEDTKMTPSVSPLTPLRSKRIAVRIFLGYLLPLIIFLILGLVVPYLLSSILGEAVKDYARTASFVDDAYSLRRAATDSENDLRGFLLYGDTGFRQQFGSTRDEYRLQFRKMKEFVSKQQNSSLDVELDLADTTYRRWYTKFATPEFAAADRALFSRNLTVSRAAARRSANGFGSVRTAMNRLVIASEGYREQQLQRARSSENLRVVFTVVIPVFAILVAIYLARNFTVAITKPIEELRLAAEEVEQGDMTRLLLDDYPYDDDEIGDLAQALSRMARTIGEREAILRAQSEAFAAIGRRIEAVLNATNDGIVLLDRAEGFSLVNDRFASLFGIDAEAIRDQTFSDVAPQFLDRFKNKSVAQNQFREWIGDWEVVGDETLDVAEPFPRTLRIYTAPVFSDPSSNRVKSIRSGIIGRIFVFRDVTRETIVDRMKTEFVSTVSHELRTPLTAIKGYIDLMISGKTGELNPVQTEFLGIVQASTRRLTDLINDMLDISRIESGRISVRHESIEYLPVVREAVRMMHQQAEARRISLQLTEPANENIPPLRGDRDRVMQVLVNLLSNAIKYTPVGGKVEVSVEVENGIVTTCIADNGIGISPEDQNRLFQKFFRADNSTTREVGGTGLGLAITKAILERMHGTIRVESELDKGSRFLFTLPAAIAETPPNAIANVPARIVSSTAPVSNLPFKDSRALLLIADEDPASLHRLTGSFRSLNYVTSSAMNNMEALRRSRDLRPDAILVNFAAKKLNVLGLLYSLRSNAVTRSIPIFLCASIHEEGQLKFRPSLVITPPNAPPFDNALTLAEEDSVETLVEGLALKQTESNDPVCVQLELANFDSRDAKTASLSLALQELIIRGTPIILHLRDLRGDAEARAPMVSLASPDLPAMTIESITEQIGNQLRASEPLPVP